MMFGSLMLVEPSIVVVTLLSSQTIRYTSLAFSSFTMQNIHRFQFKCDTKSQAYWDWSWDELTAYDLPATVKYIYTNTAEQKLHYVGHSLVSNLTDTLVFEVSNEDCI